MKFDFFTTNSHAAGSRRQGPWTKNQVVGRIADELAAYNVKANRSKLMIPGDIDLSLEFIADNYADPSTLDLNASIFYLLHDGPIFWVDLVSLIHQLTPSKGRPLSIRKTEDWDGSRVRRDCMEALGPLCAILSKKQLRDEFMAGAAVTVLGKNMKLPNSGDDAWILGSAVAILKKAQ